MPLNPLSYLARLFTPRIVSSGDKHAPTIPTQTSCKTVAKAKIRLVELTVRDVEAMFAEADAALTVELEGDAHLDLQLLEKIRVKRQSKKRVPTSFQESDLDASFLKLFGSLLEDLCCIFFVGMIGMFTQTGNGRESADHVFATFDKMRIVIWLFFIEVKTRSTYHREGWRRLVSISRSGQFDLVGVVETAESAETDVYVWHLQRRPSKIDKRVDGKWWAHLIDRVELDNVVAHPLVQCLGYLLKYVHSVLPH